jgi:hypothetical protein
MSCVGRTVWRVTSGDRALDGRVCWLTDQNEVGLPGKLPMIFLFFIFLKILFYNANRYFTPM